MMGHNGKRVAGIVGLLAVTASATVWSGTASAADDDRETVTVQADVDGDGRPNAVTLTEVSDTTQSLSFAFDGDVVDTTFEADSWAPLQAPRVTDINGDGRAELFITHRVGANTLTFGIWKFEPGQGIVRLTNSGGAPFEAYEGGGISAVNGYGCEWTDQGRRLVTVGATWGPQDPPRYSGDRQTYSVNLNALSVESRRPIVDLPREDPVLATDPATCAP